MVVSLASKAEVHTQALLMDVWKVVKPQGSVRLLEDFARSFEHSSTLANALTLAGFSQQANSTHGDIVMVRYSASVEARNRDTFA